MTERPLGTVADAAVPAETVSILTLTRNDAATLPRVLCGAVELAHKAGLNHQLVVVDRGSTDGTVGVARDLGATVIERGRCHYGQALSDGLCACGGDFVATLDADLSHDPTVLRDLLRLRHEADIVVASRYIRFGHAHMPSWRRVLSRLLNWLYASALSLPIADVTSGFRLYRRGVTAAMQLEGRRFDILPEILVRAYAQGYRVREIPFHYRPRQSANWRVRMMDATPSYLLTLLRYWRLRNSIDSADYDYRAFHSRHPVQRYWQRRRYAIVTGFVGEYARGVDLGCGSSVILDSLPNLVGMDVSQGKLRFMRGHLQNPLVAGSILDLPFGAGTFDLLICSEVIEHVVRAPRIFDEFRRVLCPSGTLILGTPDYDRVAWLVTEWLYKRLAPGGYADEHVTHYSLASLRELLPAHGFRLRRHAYVCQAELIVEAERT